MTMRQVFGLALLIVSVYAMWLFSRGDRGK